ncbi:MAG: prolyl oligopeptidase family serine peptidase, partial [Bdellovibrionaceae bacterium]|nr:prolyl oligopeptidase family serine peptidase [Pseudobdellovibrionaceae bacterium]
DHIYVEILKDVKSRLVECSYHGQKWTKRNVQLADSNGNQYITAVDDTSPHIYFGYTDFLTPTTLYYYDTNHPQKKPKKVMQSPAFFDSSQFRIEQHYTQSQDGTKIPYFMVSNKKTQLNGRNPTLLYAYGGFENPLLPSYLMVIGKGWLEKGGVYVVANIRGGGEFGPDWHKSVLLEKRHKIYEDFYAVAEDLMNRKVTDAKHLGIKGGSNGGLLTSVALTQRPELFAAVISEVPLTNMLEYHRWLSGASWMAEYGNPDDPAMHDYLASYSPVHNIKKDVAYPEPFYLTSTKDDRVHPGHARQMVARLQEMGHPVLYNENIDGGHGRATNAKDWAEFLALEFTYLYQKLF